jgi:hypothetical protein
MGRAASTAGPHGRHRMLATGASVAIVLQKEDTKKFQAFRRKALDINRQVPRPPPANLSPASPVLGARRRGPMRHRQGYRPQYGAWVTRYSQI